MPSSQHERLIQIGVFQIAAHPAVVLADRDLLCEPFLPREADLGLTVLSRRHVDINSCSNEIRQRYVAWQTERLEQLLGWLVTQSSQPDLVLFPECSIPFECLPLLHQYAIQTGIIFFAGTHTPLTSSHAQTTYKKSVGVSGANIKTILAGSPAAVLPIMEAARTTLYAKSVPSIFERTEIHPAQSGPVECAIISLGGSGWKVTPLVCAEALQLLSFQQQKPELAIIIAREQNPSQFSNVINTFVRNQIPVAIANDSNFGGSAVLTSVDRRAAEWWFQSPNHGVLPSGECYLEVAINLNVGAVEVATAAPRAPARLVKLAPIIPGDDPILAFERSAMEAATAQNANLLEGLMLAASAGPLASPMVARRWDSILAMLKSETLSRVWLDMVGSHIQTGSQVGLKALERELAGVAVRTLHGLVDNADPHTFPDEAYGQLARCHREMRNKAQLASPPTSSNVFIPYSVSTPIGRGEILPDLRAFCTKTRESIFVLSGLEAVGKTTVIATALQQAGTSVLRVPCHAGSSADYLFEYILKGGGRVPLGEAPREDFCVDDLIDAIKGFDVIWFESCHHLLHYGKYRTHALEHFLQRILEARERTSTRLVFESRWSLPLDAPLGLQIARRRLDGLAPNDAIAFFEQQLRRAGIPLETVSEEDRRTIVNLGGRHPGMLVLCADACERNGPTTVIKELKGRGGFYWAAVRRLLKAIDLSKDALRYIELLTECRMPVPMAILRQQSDESGHQDALGELIAACLVDRYPEDRIAVTQILRDVSLPDSLLSAEARSEFHQRACEFYKRQAASTEQVIAFSASIEANYHATLAGSPPPYDLAGLIDAISAAAKLKFAAEKYSDVIRLLGPHSAAGLPEDLLAMLAESYAWCDEYDMALQMAEVVVTRNRSYLRLFVQTCKAALRARRWDEARRAIERAAAYEPGSYLVALYRGRLVEKRDIDRAILFFKEACDKTDRDPWAFFYLARALIQRGRPEEALEAIERGRELVEGWTSFSPVKDIERALLSQELIALVLTGDHEHAKPILEVLERADNPRPEVILCAAYIRAFYDAETGEKQAMRAFEDALERLSRNDSRKAHTRAQIAMFKGKLLEKIGDLGKAESELNGACSLDSHNVHMKVCLLRVLRSIIKSAQISRNEPATVSAVNRAAEVARDILTYDPQQGDALYALEDLYHEFDVGKVD